MGDVRVGTSAWADRRLVASGWYPREHNTTAGRLAFYAERFPVVGVDTTQYAIPTEETTAAWAARTPDGFTFDVSVFGLFTGHRMPVDALPSDLRPAPGADRVRHRDLAPEVMDELWRRFHTALAPMSGKVGVLLMRFPEWLARGDAARERIAATARRCRPYRVAAELPHPSWYEGRHALETLRFLQAEDVAYTCLDESYDPGPVLVVTAEPGVVRLRRPHSDPALGRWAERLRTLADEVDELHVLLDTPGGRSARDALRLQSAWRQAVTAA